MIECHPGGPNPARGRCKHRFRNCEQSTLVYRGARGRCITFTDGNGASNVSLPMCDGTPGQLWNITPFNTTTGWFTIENIMSQEYIGINPVPSWDGYPFLSSSQTPHPWYFNVTTEQPVQFTVSTYDPSLYFWDTPGGHLNTTGLFLFPDLAWITFYLNGTLGSTSSTGNGTSGSGSSAAPSPIGSHTSSSETNLPLDVGLGLGLGLGIPILALAVLLLLYRAGLLPWEIPWVKKPLGR